MHIVFTSARHRALNLAVHGNAEPQPVPKVMAITRLKPRAAPNTAPRAAAASFKRMGIPSGSPRRPVFSLKVNSIQCIVLRHILHQADTLSIVKGPGIHIPTPTTPWGQLAEHAMPQQGG